MHRIVLAVIPLLLFLVILPGCGSSEPPITVPANADVIAEKLILAYDANDYAAYLDVFNASATGSVGQDWFAQTSNIITKKAGHYVPNSKVLKEVKLSGDYTEVTYKAEYSNEPDGVTVIVDLLVTDEGTYAAGVWFNSPKLFK